VYRQVFKPIFDFCLALILILLFSPVIICIFALSIYFVGWPVIFSQERPGKNGKIFTVYKFRTMTNGRDADGELLPDEMRLKGFGKFIRSTSLDELPQLFNVLLGDMSFVGPRPLLVEYLPLYNQIQARRHEVRPGITGLAQINGRNAISWEQKFEYDVEYVQNISFWLDMKIFAMTALKVLKRDGISGEGVATAKKFGGTK
jgi:undecaprenyl phosphate N,N'-diacetylbacillosamine 1-phosphate transferase